jgi:ATP-dependent exoDNAse (exonuclease V) beta subunit
LYTIEEIKPDIITESKAAGKEKIDIVPELVYNDANVFNPPLRQIRILNASHLQDKNEALFAAGGGQAEETAADKIIREAGLEAADLGTIAHACIEAYFKGLNKVEIPPRIGARLSKKVEEIVLGEAAKMRDGFLVSELGKKAIIANRESWLESEFPIVYYPDDNTIVNGSIDLLFEYEGTIYIVDYKTDSVQRPEEHRLQLEIYKKAIESIYGTDKVGAYLFYLRFYKKNEVF